MTAAAHGRKLFAHIEWVTFSTFGEPLSIKTNLEAQSRVRTWTGPPAADGPGPSGHSDFQVMPAERLRLAGPGTPRAANRGTVPRSLN